MDRGWRATQGYKCFSGLDSCRVPIYRLRHTALKPSESVRSAWKS